MSRASRKVARRLGAAACAALGVGILASPLRAGLVPGGGPASSDCYLELDVQGVENGTSQVRSNRIVLCTDGDACDADGVCGNDSCTLRVAVCLGQRDPALAACDAPEALQRVKVNARIQASVPSPPSGSACGSFVDVPVPVRVRRSGKKPGTLALPTNATAPKGTRPRKDRDKFVLQCLPRAAACTGNAPVTSTTVPGATTTTVPGATTTTLSGSTTTTVPGATTATVRVGPGSARRFDPATVRIRVGDTVQWRWDSGGHNVVSGTGITADGRFCSPNDTACATAPLSGSGTTYAHTFTEAGTFPYFCAPHASSGMTGTVVVEP